MRKTILMAGVLALSASMAHARPARGAWLRGEPQTVAGSRCVSRRGSQSSL